MKQGLSLQELATELDRRENEKADYIAETPQLVLSTNGASTLTLRNRNGFDEDVVGEFNVQNLAHRQIGERLGIPRKFYERLRTEQPKLLDHNVNTLFRAKPEKRMVRTLYGNARAFLSNGYRRLDDFDLARYVLPVLQEQPEMKIESCQITETRMYIKAVFPRIEGEIKVGDTVQAGVLIQNSEVGHGMLDVSPLVLTLACDNGMILPEYGTQKRHIGRRIDIGEEAQRLFRNETVAADDHAFFLMAQDLVRAAADEAVFKDITARLRDLAGMAPMPRPMDAIEKLANKYDLGDTEKDGVLSYLIQGGDLTAYGAMNAVTRYAQDVDDYDRSTELERTGGKFLDLTRVDWDNIIRV